VNLLVTVPSIRPAAFAPERKLLRKFYSQPRRGFASELSKSITLSLGQNLRHSAAEIAMLYWALVFLIIAILAGVLGFGGVAFAAVGIAKILFFVFLVLFIVSLVANVARRA
jgi:uncharacterized membrane protein YtjA (UPF0391 family)